MGYGKNLSENEHINSLKKQDRLTKFTEKTCFIVRVQIESNKEIDLN